MKINMIDVGSDGYMPKELRRNKDKINKILSFDPFLKDSKPKELIYNYAIWDRVCKKDLYIFNNDLSSSLFKQNYNYIGDNFLKLAKKRGYKPQMDTWFKRSLFSEKRKVKCVNIDYMIKNLNIDFHFMKSDSQGAEYQVLNGAKDFLNNGCMGLQLELFNIPMYRNIKLKDDVINLLKEYDFKLFKVLSKGGSFLSQEECVFIKNIENDYTTLIKEFYNK